MVEDNKEKAPFAAMMVIKQPKDMLRSSLTQSQRISKGNSREGKSIADLVRSVDHDTEVIQKRMSMSVKRHQSEAFTNGTIIENYLDEEAKDDQDEEDRRQMRMIKDPYEEHKDT